MAGDAHEVILDRGQRGPRLGGARSLGGPSERGKRGEDGRERRGGALHSAHTRCPSSGESVVCSQCLVTWKRRTATMRPSRPMTNVSGTPVVPNARTKFPLTSRSTG